MKAQKPAMGIEQTRDFGDSKFYKVSCDCGNPDDEINLEVEAQDPGGVVVHVWTTVKTPWWEKAWDNDSWLAGLVNGLSHRLRMTWWLWTRGYLKQESWTILTEQQALNFAETLKTAIRDTREFRNKRKQAGTQK